MISATVVSRSRSWTVRLDVSGAPDTKRDYSDHMIRPDRLELSYLAMNGGAPRVATVRLQGTSVKTGSMRLSAEWHEVRRLPEWILPIVREYAP